MTTHDRGGLPLPDFDHLPTGALESRIRSLRSEELDRLLRYEHEHADRPQVVQLLTSRKRQLDAGAEPTGGDPSAFRPEQAGRPSGGSRVSPTTSPEPSSPPSHGTPEQQG
ncbi:MULTISPECIES: hypothetical protein [Streptomyces]|uniref:DUF8129 domain-containing protein n=1 Tax=Streptomyces sudanensis TaxID=436397 RepID=A0ABY4TH98_9ACTN|nr:MULTISPECIES: hypothetical protein [Streptomyces]MCP9959957.1 hypothetical protein [Streptomyces sudanensis]MCP9988973.1 hypothetical protein [Streptomyces sudanensis]MCP9999638.1 hypothetical protein [Streptomyces sudanensis]URN18282.1 hypothetical protein MW084_22665 [Streptomyces sudanensis]